MSTSPLHLPGAVSPPSPPAIVSHAAPPVGADLAFAQPDTGVDWRRVLQAVARFKWLIIAGTILGTAAGLAATTFRKPQYAVRAAIWIDKPAQRGDRHRGRSRRGQPCEAE